MPDKPTTERPVVNASWKIVSFTHPLLWTRTEEEVWMLHPQRRYILNADQIKAIGPHVDTMSELKGSTNYRPLLAGSSLAGARVLVYRHLDRGIGDHLFMTGPMNYLRHVAGNNVEISMYGLTDRHQILAYHPALKHEAVLAGPLQYDDLPFYHYHWFVETATEYDEEFDQMNVYDSLYTQMGVDPTKVDIAFKRPSLRLVEKDFKDLDQLYYFIYANRKIDLRTTPYYVVAPASYSSLRAAPYSTWLTTIVELSKARPVIVIGRPGKGRIPDTDMSFGQFVAELNKIPGAINLLSDIPLRTTAAIIARSTCLVTLDTGILYIAEALNIPAVSIWGTHAPATRIGYDKKYLDLAIWHREACPACPCFAYAAFPQKKCIRNEMQRICEPFIAVKAEEIIAKVTEAEKLR